MKILISGAPQCGKTTIMNKIIHELKVSQLECMGCLVHEVKQDNSRVGFNICYFPSHETEILASKTDTYSDFYIGKYSVNVAGINEKLIPFMHQMAHMLDDKIIIFDEIGRMQNCSQLFLPTLDQLMHSAHTMLASIVHDDEVWARPYKTNEKVFLIPLDEKNRQDVFDLIMVMLKKREWVDLMPTAQFADLIKRFQNTISQQDLTSTKNLFK